MLLQEIAVDAARLQAEGVEKKDPELVRKSQETFLRILDQAPDDPGILFSLGTGYLLLGSNGMAINLFRRALCYDPANPSIHCNIAAAYRAEERNEDAERHLIIANTLHEDPEYLSNLAALWVNRGHPERGIPFGEAALKLNPACAKAAWNLALLYLEDGNYRDGFSLYTAGIDTGDRYVKRLKGADGELLPMWDGAPGKRLVVYGEQGLGDEIMFASALEELARDSEFLVIDSHPRLETVFRRTFGGNPKIKAIFGERKKMESDWDKEHGFDAMVPIGNLFFHYRRGGEFPRTAYLKPCPEKTAYYRKKLEELGPPPYIGFSWVGGSKHTHSVYRSAKLGYFRELLASGGTFVSLQYTDVHDKIKRFNESTPFVIHELPEAVNAFDYDETFALVNALDVVVSVCTSVVHVCGAIGKNCIVMTPFQRAWRYGKEPAMYQYGDWVTQFHKQEREEWPEYVERLLAWRGLCSGK